MKGYIYIRSHSSYNEYNACKLGKASNIPERDIQYATGEIKRGNFELVLEVEYSKMNFIERLLQNEFYEYNIKYDAGTEFYSNKIIELIEPYLNSTGIKYKKLSKQEINDLVRCNRVRKTLKKINIKSLITYLKSNKTKEEIIQFKPREDQIEIIDKAISYFQVFDKGMLVLICGVGKTLISLWITQRLNCNKILIGVPNILLLEQWKKIIKILFKNISYLIVSGDVDNEYIINFLEKNKEKCIIITTYSSSYKVYNATKKLSYIFDIKINDEMHHLTSTNMKLTDTTKKFIQMLKIQTIKQLSLTATLKLLEYNEDIDGNIVSNDNVEYFGNIIDRKYLLWAIQKNIVCDYLIQTIITNEEDLENQLIKFRIEEENDKRLFLSAFASLKSIFDGHSKHLLIYSNNKENSLKLIQYIDLLLENNYFNISDLYYSNYHSDMRTKDQKKIIENFGKYRFGIITCVYCLGEGWDFPILDGVVFSENMSSNIRIVQSVLRASRKNNMEPNKKTKIILPILNKIDWLENNDNSDLRKVREIIYQIGLEDETISQKIKVFKINFEKQKSDINQNEESKKNNDEFGEYDDELTQRLKLKTVKRVALSITYEKARKIIAEKNINSKESYYELCDRDDRLSKEPEIIFKGKFTNWIDYLSIKRIYYDLDTCKNKIEEYLSNELYLDFEYTNITKFLKNKDNNFPPYDLWCEYYDIYDLTLIINQNKNDELVKF